MASEIAAQMLRRRHQLPVDQGETPGHPHLEAEHSAMDRQHAFESAIEGLQSLEKEGMPGASELVQSLQKQWHAFVAQKGGAPMQPAAKASHRASPVSKSPVDQQEEDMYHADNTDMTKDY